MCYVSDLGFMYCAPQQSSGPSSQSSCSITSCLSCSKPEMCGGFKCIHLNGNDTCTFTVTNETQITTASATSNLNSTEPTPIVNSIKKCISPSKCLNDQPCLNINGVDQCLCGPQYAPPYCHSY